MKCLSIITLCLMVVFCDASCGGGAAQASSDSEEILQLKSQKFSPMVDKNIFLKVKDDMRNMDDNFDEYFFNVAWECLEQYMIMKMYEVHGATLDDISTDEWHQALMEDLNQVLKRELVLYDDFKKIKKNKNLIVCLLQMPCLDLFSKVYAGLEKIYVELCIGKGQDIDCNVFKNNQLTMKHYAIACQMTLKSHPQIFVTMFNMMKNYKGGEVVSDSETMDAMKVMTRDFVECILNPDVVQRYRAQYDLEVGLTELQKEAQQRVAIEKEVQEGWKEFFARKDCKQHIAAIESFRRIRTQEKVQQQKYELQKKQQAQKQIRDGEKELRKALLKEESEAVTILQNCQEYKDIVMFQKALAEHKKQQKIEEQQALQRVRQEEQRRLKQQRIEEEKRKREERAESAKLLISLCANGWQQQDTILQEVQQVQEELQEDNDTDTCSHDTVPAVVESDEIEYPFGVMIERPPRVIPVQKTIRAPHVIMQNKAPVKHPPPPNGLYWAIKAFQQEKQ